VSALNDSVNSQLNQK